MFFLATYSMKRSNFLTSYSNIGTPLHVGLGQLSDWVKTNNFLPFPSNMAKTVRRLFDIGPNLVQTVVLEGV